MEGIVGYVNAPYIENCYNIGEIMIDDYDKIGGIIGKYNDVGCKNRCINTYYCQNNDIGVIAGVFNDYNGISRYITKEELKAKAEELGASYSSDINNTNGGFPYLKWLDN